MEIRRASVVDAADIADVHVRTWQAAYAHVFGAERLAGMDTDARTGQWRRWLAQGEVAFVADDDGRIVGFVWVGPSREPDAEGELFAIYVLPEAWGSDAGHALMQAGIAALCEAGYRDAILWVLDDNPRARRFYEREGWKLDGAAKEGEFVGLSVAEVRYRIAL